MLKQLLLLITLLFCLFNSNAQEKNNIKLTIETGFLPFSLQSENLGLFLNVEPKIKVIENTFLGLRFGVGLNPNTFDYNDNSQFYINEEQDHAVISFVPTIDYYLNINNYGSYLGGGLGFYLMSDIDVFRVFIVNPSEDVFVVSVNERIGFLLRGGFELDKLRLGMEYNFTPKADIKIPNGQIIGRVANSYLGLSIGFVIGGGKRSASSNPKED